MTDPRYPIGQFQPADAPLTGDERQELLAQIADAPTHLRAAVAGLTAAQLDTPYRQDGWTVRQLVHHVADSHMNGYVRTKLALTEAEPAIKTYDEARWAELADTQATPIETSLGLLDALHQRWAALLRALTPAERARTFLHPEWGQVSLDKQLALYAWHGRHHTAHVTALRARMGWH
ncbi:MAG TPA: putative metal-dependent hydrolase [Pyrinomonadaceae bacterium]|jgi:uncharacterized damage-inducible protein DinB